MLSIARRHIQRIASSVHPAKMSTGAVAAGPAAYSYGVQFFHWTMGGALAGAVATVLLAQSTPKEEAEKKGRFMFLHKSCGTLAAMLLVPRLISRAVSKSPIPIPGAHAIEHIAANISHAVMYGFAVFMPVSGVAMGYFGGGGLPFFFTKFDAAKEKRGDIAGPAFKWHKKAGAIFEYLIPLHIAGAMGHLVRGHTIFGRIIPWGK